MAYADQAAMLADRWRLVRNDAGGASAETIVDGRSSVQYAPTLAALLGSTNTYHNWLNRRGKNALRQ
jgi:hypothetical protein